MVKFMGPVLRGHHIAAMEPIGVLFTREVFDGNLLTLQEPAAAAGS